MRQPRYEDYVTYDPEPEVEEDERVIDHARLQAGIRAYREALAVNANGQ